MLTSPDVTETSVVAVFGAGSLYGFTHVSEVLKGVERDVRGRLVVFFPGTLEQNNYRLLDARDGWRRHNQPAGCHQISEHVILCVQWLCLCGAAV